MPRSVCELFRRQSINRLRHDYLPKIETCLTRLPDDKIWWRPNPATNSVGNLVLHLAGNLTQWIVHGMGGAEDVRRRSDEFAAQDGAGRDELRDRIRAAVDGAVEVVGDLTENDLVTERTIQIYRVSGLAAVYHAVEHFAGHVGQIIWVTKMVTDEDLAFYGDSSLE